MRDYLDLIRVNLACWLDSLAHWVDAPVRYTAEDLARRDREWMAAVIDRAHGMALREDASRG